MRKYLWIFFLIIIISTVLHSSNAFAESSYVLPYPSAMPGSVSYKTHLIWESIMKYWHFGTFGRFTYNVKQADKYLVEAKTLFEYKQYLLGSAALKSSNYYFSQIPKALSDAMIEGKPIDDKKDLFKQEAQKHIEILMLLQKEIPAKFIWQPEKANNKTLQLHDQMEEAIRIREKAI